MRDNIASVFHPPGVVPHPADPNVRENVPHARHLEPEASHHEGTHPHTCIAHVFQLTMGRKECRRIDGEVKGYGEDMGKGGGRLPETLVLLTKVYITCVLVCLYSLSNNCYCIL